jgi:nicotinate-nucleotide pyrophosphorylase (carboxylating)
MTALSKEKTIPLIKMALDEDLGTGDVTSNAIFSGMEKSCASINAKQDGIVCGGILVSWVYELIDREIAFTQLIPEGSPVKSGEAVIRLVGSTRSLLAGERTGLNFFQRLSGIATMTNNIVKHVEGTGISILDTRKTLPGFRMLDKYAVRTGGGTNHRIGLFDMVMIKDNHIKAAGSITKAVDRVRGKWADQFKIEVETTSLDEVKEALASNVEIIMLDNMTIDAMREAAQLIDKRAKIEISGNITEQRIAKIRDLPVDFISLGALTHSVIAFDYSMKFTDL